MLRKNFFVVAVVFGKVPTSQPAILQSKEEERKKHLTRVQVTSISFSCFIWWGKSEEVVRKKFEIYKKDKLYMTLRVCVSTPTKQMTVVQAT